MQAFFRQEGESLQPGGCSERAAGKDADVAPHSMQENDLSKLVVG